MSDVKVYARDLEQAAQEQIDTLANLPAFEDAKIRIMPDAHAGAGCVIGFTANLGEKVVPNLIGVDIGCLDADSEVLTPDGWIKICDYDNQDILVYNYKNDYSWFEKPYAYINQPCDGFYHVKSKYGLDMVLSKEHTMLVWMGYGQQDRTPILWNVEDFVGHHNSLAKGIAGGVKTTFNLRSGGLGLKDEEVRVWVMLSADGHIDRASSQRNNAYEWTKEHHNVVNFHFSKTRKIERCTDLLTEAGYKYKCVEGVDGTVYITTEIPDFMTKSLRPFFRASQHELSVLVDEVMYWDGSVDEKRGHSFFSSTTKENIDAVQFAFAANGIRCGIHRTDKDGHGKECVCYQCYTTKNHIVGFPASNFEYIETQNARKYCFTTSTGAFVMRRNGRIQLTHNCGLFDVELASNDFTFERLDEVIRKVVPHGFGTHNRKTCDVESLGLRCFDQLKGVDRLDKSMGTLGGGNHFLSIGEDPSGLRHLVIHTGSRNLGLQVANIYQRKAIETCDADVPNDLRWLEGQDADDYLHDMWICQRWAVQNRETIAKNVLVGLRVNEMSSFQTIHNYLGDDGIIRKGAISAKEGERVLIPLNMRDGCLICTGLGNEDWNNSAPHGAGRTMSRRKAKDTLSLDEFKSQMSGVYSTTICEATLDEAPNAYKPAQDIIDAIDGVTVTVDQHLREVYNFKSTQEGGWRRKRKA